MTKKDFIVIARAFNDALKQYNAAYKNQNAQIVVNCIVDYLVSEMQSQNPRFDRKRFRNAVYDGVIV